MPQVNWKGLLGDRWPRFVYENIGSTCTGAKVCSDACSCNLCVGTSSFGMIFFILATLSWMCVGIHRRKALPSPVCA